VDQVVRSVGASQCSVEADVTEYVCLNYFNVPKPWPICKLGWRARNTHHLVTSSEELGDEASTDVAGGAGNGNAHGDLSKLLSIFGVVTQLG